jgi:dTDP-4-amino-4,6-dideoxygalactose transaminase
MIFPTYICDIFKPILEEYNIKPLYIDVDLKTFNFLIDDIEKMITPNTKSILVCHTYGKPNDIKRIKVLAEKYNLKIIEDCARAFGIKYENKYLGNFSDCAIFSLPKFLPAATGGVLISKKPVDIKLDKSQLKIKSLIKFIRLFPFWATITEKFRIKENTIKTQKPGVAHAASKQSLKIFDWYLDNFNEQIDKRNELIAYFTQKLEKIGIYIPHPSTYISALIPNRNELFNKLRKKNIFCARTWHNPIYPYLPNTKMAAEQIINFPLQNWFTKKDIDKIINGILSSMG